MSTKRPVDIEDGESSVLPQKKTRRQKPHAEGDAKNKPKFPLDVAVVSKHWHGLDEISDVVAFGDSTTRFGNSITWLGHFNNALDPMNASRSQEPHLTSVRARNYAYQGATVEDDLDDQLLQMFAQFPRKKKPDSLPSLDSDTTLYGGILAGYKRLCTESDDLEEIVDKLFEDGLNEIFVKAGGRNFLIIDVPPKDRSPGAQELSDMSSRYTTWNELLRQRTKAFAEDSAGVSVFLFSSYAMISDILDNPEDYGFTEDDTVEEGGAIWQDELHLTTEVHGIFTEKLVEALRAI